MLSPSPYSIVVWSLLAFYGARKMQPKTVKQWLHALSTCAFVVGLVVMPFDSLWIVFQIARFGYLYPDEAMPILLYCLTRNITIFLLCIYETRKVRLQLLNVKSLVYLPFFIPLFILWFGLAPDPSWTDWTYAFRYNYSNLRVFQAFIISHIFMKSLQGIIYIKLWKRKI